MNAAALAARRRSEAAVDLGRPNEAVRFAKEAVAADPTDAGSFCQLANAHNLAGDYSPALEAADRAASLAPDLEWAHALRASALLNAGNPRQALTAVDQALRIDPTLGGRYRLRARCLDALGRKKEAEDAASRACELAPGDPLALDLLADLAFAAKRYPEAENAWRAALRLDPTSAHRLNTSGAALDRQGRKDDARDAYRRAIRMDPSLEVAKRNLHKSVRASLGKGSLVAGGGAIALIKWGALGASGCVHVLTASGAASVAIIVVLAVVGGALVRGALTARRARQHEADLEARDPELMALYRQIDRDLEAGRIARK
jgi:tetratricopeptide (TPR) repeat protein